MGNNNVLPIDANNKPSQGLYDPIASRVVAGLAGLVSSDSDYPYAPLVLDNFVSDAIKKGKAFQVTNNQTAGNYTNNYGISLFNPSGSGKNIFVYGIRMYYMYGDTQVFININNADFALGTALTAHNLNLGSATTSIATISYTAPTVNLGSTPGTTIESVALQPYQTYDVLSDIGILVSPGTALAAFMYVSNATQKWSETFKWVEI